jgi:copper transport protein
MAAVATLAVTGALQAWREVGSWAALTTTDYGRLLVAKLVGVAVLVALGDQGRRAIARLARRPPSLAIGRLRTVVLAEVVLALCVLTVTTLLVSARPALLPSSLRVIEELQNGSLDMRLGA